MNGSTVKKALRRVRDRSVTRLADRVYGQGLVFVHVPKCAGTSFEAAVRPLYRFSHVCVHAENTFAAARLGAPPGLTRHDLLNRASALRQQLLPYYLAAGIKCVTGHAPLGRGVIDAYRGTHHFVTILRHPVERFISHYSFSHLSNDRHGNIEEPLDAFLDTPRARNFGALYIKYYSEVVPGEPYDRTVAIAQAKATLAKMAAVGFVDRLDVFAAGLSARLGRTLWIGHRNRTSEAEGSGGRREKIAIDPGTRRRIENLCEPDLEIYEWARTRFGG